MPQIFNIILKVKSKKKKGWVILELKAARWQNINTQTSNIETAKLDLLVIFLN